MLLLEGYLITSVVLSRQPFSILINDMISVLKRHNATSSLRIC